MAEVVPVWPRHLFQASQQPTKILFVCFGRGPLADVEISAARFGLPSLELAARVDVREHRRDVKPGWFESWWGEAFGSIAQRDLAASLPFLTHSDVCFTLGLSLPDQADLAPLQTVWGLSRWLCARGANVVLDVHAFRYRTRAEVEALSFDEADVARDVKIVLETEPTQNGLHLMHTRGLCKVARPELLSFIRPEDEAAVGRLMSQVARTLMEGAAAEQIRLRVADGVELVTSPGTEQALVASLGLEAGVLLGRSDGESLAGITRFVSEP
ncbi:MAG: hypothetical protein EOO73_23265 [Myxococcales bacterium]|nr:MAG: hypothetical protein EOO73_23265 [Myxococcales bacterium]